MSKEIFFAMGIHNHQPVGNFDYIIEDAFKGAYLPFINVLEEHPSIKINIHFTGILFNWLKEYRPEYLNKLRELVKKGQLELISGGFYEPILSNLLEHDQIGQIRKLSAFINNEFNCQPKGMWLAERVWEPLMAKPIHLAGIEYVLLDETHFRFSGLEENQIFGYYVTEHEGYPLKVFPINQTVRHAIPFKPPEYTLKYLYHWAEENKPKLVVMADDGEKFGVWPDTYRTVYEEGWLHRFFNLVEQNQEWLKMVTFSEYLNKYPPQGRIYITNTSYVEMTEWALPAKASVQLLAIKEQLEREGRLERLNSFIMGGFWRHFLTKYDESNNMQKKSVYVSRKIESLPETSGKREQGQNELWQGQCNCGYWHGVFGGLYLTHLRAAIYEHLINAELIADKYFHVTKTWLDIDILDLDVDGAKEVLINTDVLNLYFKPSRGGVLFELDYKPKAINFVDTISRQIEPYHAKVPYSQVVGDSQELVSIHHMVKAKEAGLEKYLNYDWYKRTCFIDHFLAPNTSLESFACCQYGEQGNFVDQDYGFSFSAKFANKTKELCLFFQRNGNVWVGSDFIPVEVEKSFYIQENSSSFKTVYKVTNKSDKAVYVDFAVEFNLSFLTGKADDRFYRANGTDISEPKLNSIGELNDVSQLEIVDQWRKVAAVLDFKDPVTLWRFPIETISQSEGGFERVYQNSVVLPKWQLHLEGNSSWETEITFKIEDLG